VSPGDKSRLYAFSHFSMASMNAVVEPCCCMAGEKKPPNDTSRERAFSGPGFDKGSRGRFGFPRDFLLFHKRCNTSDDSRATKDGCGSWGGLL